MDNDKPTDGRDTDVKPRRRRWLRRIVVGILGLVVLLALFHRPLIFEGTRYFVLRAAKQQHLALDYTIGGSIFTTLSVTDLKATPIEPGPIQRLEIGSVDLRYSLWDLVRKGLPSFLRQLEVRNVFLELTPGEPLPPDKAAKPQAIKFPALIPELLNIENVNVTIHASGGDTRLEGFSFSLLPDRDGVLKIGNLEIPGVRQWKNISATTTYRERHLVLKSVVVDPDIILSELHLDLSRLNQAELATTLEGTFFQAPVSLKLQVTDLNANNHLALEATASGLGFAKVREYLRLTVPAEGSLENLSLSFDGIPTTPSGWRGRLHLRAAGLNYDQKSLEAIELEATADQGLGRIEFRGEPGGKNSIALTAEGNLPGKLADFPRTTIHGKMDIRIPETEALHLGVAATGDLSVAGEFSAADSVLKSQFAVESQALAVAGLRLTRTHLKIDLQKDLHPAEGSPAFRGLDTKIEGGIGRVGYLDYDADAIGLKLATRDAEVTLEQLDLVKDTNTLRASASYTLPDDLASWDRQPLKIDLTAEAPKLAAFLAPGSTTTLKGVLRLGAKLVARDRILNGTLDAEGRDIEFNRFPVRSLDAHLTMEENKVSLSRLDVVLNDRNGLKGSGEVKLDGAYPYRADLAIKLADLAIFRPIMGANPPALGGNLTMLWKGEGEARGQQAGYASMDLTDGLVGNQKGLKAHFNGSYAADFINLPDFTVSAQGLGDAAFSLFWKDNRLGLSGLRVRQKKQVLLEGNANLPLHLAEWRDLARLVPAAEPVSVSLLAKNIDLGTALRDADGKKPPLTGKLNLNIDLQGPMEDLQGDVSLAATGLQSAAVEKITPADLSVTLDLRHDWLSLEGGIRQKSIQPLRLTGGMPLDAAALIRTGSLPAETPLDFRALLPRSSLAFLTSLVPSLRRLDGTADIDVGVGGSLAKPAINGHLNADISSLRFVDPSLPPVNRTEVRLEFTGDQLAIRNCRGIIAGGSFDAGGSIGFKDRSNPILDLRLGSLNALVMQNDDITARVSCDLRVTGPLNAGLVRGDVWVTRSRFFRDIDILPIGLPGRPAPQPPPEPTIVSFPNPPLRDWKFDVAIRTADPFLVQGNLANGRVVMDLRIGGTGLEPWMDGAVTIEKLTTSLPFSRLNIESGQIFFTKQDPFIPQLNIRGTSTIRDHDVMVFITGPVTAPDAVFTSSPPLPQAEVVSLIATGMTTTELGSDPNALAGRAAILLFRKLYESVFRRNRPPPENDSFLQRIQFDIGTTDTRTGHQSTTLGIPLSDRIMLTGGLDVGGNFQGQVKYLIRFQ